MISNVKNMHYVIIGEPVALTRSREQVKKTWNAQKQLRFERRTQLEEQHKGLPLFTGPISLEMEFFFPLEHLQKITNTYQRYHIFKPTLTGLTKFIEHIAANILYPDDSLIVSITTKKLYTKDTPRTELTITQLRI